MGTGTDVAMESAGVTLVKGDLRGIVRARRLSQGTMGNIRQNLFFAFIYNALGVPITAGVLYPVFGLLLRSIIASAAMTFSSGSASWCCSVDTRARPIASARQAASSNSINTRSAIPAKARHRADRDSQRFGYQAAAAAAIREACQLLAAAGYAKGIKSFDLLGRENHPYTELLLTDHPVSPYNAAIYLVLCCSCRRSRTGRPHMKHTQTYRCLHALLMSCLQTRIRFWVRPQLLTRV